MKALILNRKINIDYFYAEAIKTLRTNVLLSGSNTRVIMFTSAKQNEGKSDIAFSFASSLSEIGNKVVFVDADMRKSVMTTRYNINEQIFGLSQYLCGQKKLEEVVYTTDIPRLSIVFAGPSCPNPAELLEESAFAEMIKILKGECDYIIIDTPPLGAVIDAAIIAKNCDGTILVIESGAVSYRLELNIKNQLAKTECRIIGAVLNKAPAHDDYYQKSYARDTSYKINHIKIE